MKQILLVEPNYKTTWHPLGLMRISTYHKDMKDSVAFIKGEHKIDFVPDMIYVSTLFTYKLKETVRTIRYYRTEFPKAEIIAGGVSATTLKFLIEKYNITVHQGLSKDFENCAPDYSLFPDMDTSYTYTHRGCTRKCPFCVVPIIEPKFYNRDWLKDVNPKFKNLILMDNNWLAKDKESWLDDVRKLKDLCKNGNLRNIDWNQALDVRFCNEETFKHIKGLPIKPLRFSFDHMGQDGHIQRNLKLAKKYKFHNLRITTLYNWLDTVDDFYYRVKEIVRHGATSIPMCYMPLGQDDKDYVGKYWTKKERDGVTKINPFKGQISTNNIEDFEFFFGKDAKEFRKLLNYNKLDELTHLKQSKFKRMKVCRIKSNH